MQILSDPQWWREMGILLCFSFTSLKVPLFYVLQIPQSSQLDLHGPDLQTTQFGPKKGTTTLTQTTSTSWSLDPRWHLALPRLVSPNMFNENQMKIKRKPTINEGHVSIYIFLMAQGQ